MSFKGLNIGAYGWKHEHWSGGFYPDDLPPDWQLTYYSNAFNCVLVPVEYWCEQNMPDCEEWLENVHDEFRFHIACDERLLECVPLEDLETSLNILKPVLASLVFLPAGNHGSESAVGQFASLIEALGVDVFGAESMFDQAMLDQTSMIWQKPGDSPATRFACIDDDVSDMREARKIIEAFVQQLPAGAEVGESDDINEATLIVADPKLEAEALSKLRSVVEIIGL
jgi:hypothetical protein